MAEDKASPPVDGEVSDIHERLTLSSTASELTRIINGGSVVPGKGYLSFNMGDDEEEEEEEEEAEEFVAVDHDDASDFSFMFRRSSHARRRTPLDDLYPFTSILTLSNVDDCVAVEEAFPEEERASREKACVSFLFFFCLSFFSFRV